MTPERWRRISGIFHEALLHEPETRAAYLDSACSRDDDLRAEVEGMLTAHRDAEGFDVDLLLADSTAAESECAPRTGALTSGARLGPYEIISFLGSGGMGEVYRARHDKLGRHVAIKVLPPEFAADEQRLRRFEREARTASSLSHPNIVTIYDVAEDRGMHYISMELVQGQTLRSRLESGSIAVCDLVGVGGQIADGLAKAHAAGIVHRDLKPENLMVTGDGHLKILDFGLSKLAPQTAPRERRVDSADDTRPGAILGTIPYMSPEQAAGRPVDHRSDQFALGSILLEMATGRRAFQRDSAPQTLAAIIEADPEGLAQARATLPGPLVETLERCLAKDPQRRFASTDDLAGALKGLQSAALTESRPARRRSKVRGLAPVGGLTVLGSLTLALAFDLGGARTSLLRPGTRIRSVAVLPLENLSGDPAQEVIADGIHAALLTDLARLDGFERVTARQSVSRYKGSSKALREIARELGVDAVMTGSFVRLDDRVQITAQLVEASNERTLWAGRYEREMRDVLALQNAILSAMTREIRVKLSPQAEARLSKAARTVDPAAYELCLRGKALVSQLTPEGIQRGLEYFQQAVEADPSDPMPHAGLAIAYSLVGHSVDPEAYVKARTAAQKALALDDSLADVHEALAMISLYQVWDWPAAEESFRTALDLDASLPGAHANYGWYLQLIGRREEGITEEIRSMRLDPLNPVFAAWVGAMYWDAARHDEAIDAAKKSVELNPSFPWGHYVLGGVYAAQGKFDAAVAQHRKMAEVSADGKWVLALTYAFAGRDLEARALAAEVAKGSSPKAALGLGLVHAELGDADEAFRWLNRMVDLRDSWGPWVSVPGGQWRSLDPLRNDPRFRALLQRMNLPG
jgi:serine/threonine protein kinase/TolB-like protein/tetratricopeptide (TPR) repeat protein